jgi:hypothetical protein
MRKRALTIFGALLIAGLTVQIAAATEHHARTDDRSNYRAYNRSNEPFYEAPQTRGYPADYDGCGWPNCASAHGG